MNVAATIQGEGTVTGTGIYSMGDTVTLTATPSAGAIFSQFLNGSTVVSTASPYVFTVPSDTNIELIAVFIVSLEGYLRASVGFEIPDASLMKIRFDRGFTLNQDITTVEPRLRELAYADCLMYLVNSPSQPARVKEADGGWSHETTGGAIDPADKRAMRREANAIYRKYNDKVLVASVRLVSLNGVKADGCARY